MIVNHTTGVRVTLSDILRTYCRIVADDSQLIGTVAVQGKGYRARWADVGAPTDAELRSVGHSYVVETEQPTPGDGEYVRPGPLELVGDAWRQTWIVEPIPPPEVPEQVYGHQMRAVLYTRQFGESTLMQTVLALVAQLPEPQQTITRDSLLTASVMRRDSPTILAFAQALQLDAEYLDALFTEAAEVRV